MVRLYRTDPEELPFKVELWSLDGNHIELVLAQARNQLVARAAYKEAVAYQPDRLIMLRMGARVIESSSRA